MRNPISWETELIPRRKDFPSPIGQWAAVNFTHYNVLGCLIIQLPIALSFFASDWPLLGILSIIPSAYLLWIAILYHTHIRSFASLSQMARDFIVRPILDRFATGNWAIEELSDKDLSFADRLLRYEDATRYLWLAILNICVLVWTCVTLSIRQVT